MTNETFIEDLMLVRMPAWWENPWLLAVAPILLGALIYWLTRWWMKRPGRVSETAIPSGPPLHEDYLRKLEELRKRRMELTAYQLTIEVGELLRGYLEARYSFNIRYQTTREFLESVTADGRFNPVHRVTLSEFLGLCDAVKFAQRPATPSEQDGLIDTAERFIRECAGVVSGEVKRP